MKINYDYWKPRIATLAISISFILIGVIAISSKHIGKVNGIQYYGIDAVLIGIVFAVAGVICLIVGLRNPPK